MTTPWMMEPRTAWLWPWWLNGSMTCKDLAAVGEAIAAGGGEGGGQQLLP
jgi:hypothetical protein